METYVVIDKAVGETPLMAVEKFRASRPEYKEKSLAYAGRLDPMASGKLLVLIGEECKQQEKYHKLDKGYYFQVLFGTRSDTGDILGILNWKNSPKFDQNILASTAKKLTGKISLLYPVFSSKTVRGKPLHLWALEKRLNEIEIPTANTTIHKLKLVDLKTYSAESVYKTAISKIDSLPAVTEKSKLLGANFRRDDVHMSWNTWLEYHKKQELQIATFYCVCSSGTYMRSLAEEIGRKFETPALAYSIKRTKIGRYKKILGLFGFWSKKY